MEEFVIEWLKGQTVAAITAPSGSALKNKLIKLTQEHPNECDYYLNDDGSVFGHVPVKYIRLNVPREFSEETLEKYRQQAKVHLAKNGQKSLTSSEVV